MYKFRKDPIDKTDVLMWVNKDGRVSTIPFDPDNTDYQAYLKWLDEGNEPLPADE